MDNRVERLTRLIRAAIAGTERGELVWTAFDDETFHTTFGPGSLRITRGKTMLGDSSDTLYPAPTYPFWVLDAEGHIADEYEYINDPAARDLFLVARDSAFGTGRLIDSMLTVLEPRT